MQIPLRPLELASWRELVPPGARIDLSQGLVVAGGTPEGGADLARSLVGSIDPSDLLGLGPEDPETRLQEALARRYRVAPEAIVPTPSAGQALVQALLALLRPGDHLIVERPTEERLYRVPELLGASVARIDRRLEDAWQLVPERLAKVLTPRTRALVLTNLHCVSGVACPPKTLAELAALAARVGAAVLVDEVHLEFAWGDEAHVRPACLVADNAISVSSVSAALALPELRVGWLVARDPELARALRSAAGYLDARVPAASALLAACALDQLASDMAARTSRATAAGLRVVERWARAEPRVELVPPHAGLHALLRLPKGISDLSLAAHLRERYETQVVPGALLEAPGCVRLSVVAPTPQLEQGLANLSAALDDLAAPRP